MRHSFNLAACLSLLFAVLPAVPNPDPATPDDRQRFQGTWHVTWARTANEQSDQVFRSGTLRVTGEVARFYNGSVLQDEVSFTLDPKKKPKEINLYGPRQENRGMPLLGIYEVTDDQLKLYWNVDKVRERPTSFDPQPGRTRYFLILKRQDEK